MSLYVFPGLWPFVERVARGRDLHHLGRARDLWHCKQIQDALGQIPRLDPESRRHLIGHVCKIRASLAVALEGIDAAILEVAREFDLLAVAPDPTSASTSTPTAAAAGSRGPADRPARRREPHSGNRDTADVRS
jgi:hypothetical protein